MAAQAVEREARGTHEPRASRVAGGGHPPHYMYITSYSSTTVHGQYLLEPSPTFFLFFFFVAIFLPQQPQFLGTKQLGLIRNYNNKRWNGKTPPVSRVEREEECHLIHTYSYSLHCQKYLEWNPSDSALMNDRSLLLFHHPISELQPSVYLTQLSSNYPWTYVQARIQTSPSRRDIVAHWYLSSMLQLDVASKSMPHSTSADNPSQKKNFTISSPAPPDAFSNCLFAWTDLGESRANSNRKAPRPPSDYTTILKRPVQSILVLLHSPQTPPFPFSPPLRSESGSVSAYVQHPLIWGEKRRLNHSLLWCDSRPRIVINLSSHRCPSSGFVVLIFGSDRARCSIARLYTTYLDNERHQQDSCPHHYLLQNRNPLRPPAYPILPSEYIGSSITSNGKLRS